MPSSQKPKWNSCAPQSIGLKKEGAKVILDGRKTPAPAEMQSGNWIGPTILDHVKPGSDAHTTELFGPVLSIIRCKDLSEALAIQATSAYGNACSVFTSSGALADRVTREAKAGMVGVNVGVPVPREPFRLAECGLQSSDTATLPVSIRLISGVM